MNDAFVVQQVSDTVDNVSAALVGSIPVILGVFAALVGLGMLLRYLKKWIGRKA